MEGSDKIPIRIMLVASDEPIPLDQWQDWMRWCPSQCYYHTQRNGIDYVLYLRWRWNDPWEGHIVKNASSEQNMVKGHAEWTPDLFEFYNLEFTANQVDEAKAKLLELFEKTNHQ